MGSTLEQCSIQGIAVDRMQQPIGQGGDPDYQPGGRQQQQQQGVGAWLGGRQRGPSTASKRPSVDP